MKIKIFEFSYYPDSTREYEEQLNNWIKDNDVEIKEMSQSQVGTHLIYSFIYYDKKELRKVKLDKINEL